MDSAVKEYTEKILLKYLKILKTILLDHQNNYIVRSSFDQKYYRKFFYKQLAKCFT